MKVKIFALVAAFFMLMGGSAWAQADVKGDVNKDGVVNEQDIAAILAIMAKNNGVAENVTTKYYWYVGQSMPDAVDESTWKSSTKDAGFTATVDVLEGDTYLVIPNNWTYSAKDAAGDDFAFNAFVKPADKTKITGYTIYRIAMNGSEKVTITFSK